MKHHLFVGSFLSKHSGSKSVSEKLKRDLQEESINIILVSKFQNKLFRLIEILIGVLFYSYEKIHIDTFSGPSFMIAEIATFFGKFRKKRIIINLRGGALPEFYENGNQKRVKELFQKADIVLSPSMYLQNFFKKNDLEVVYLPNSITNKSFPYDRSNITPFSLLWVRAFTEIYNPELAIHTLYEVRKEFPLARLTMIGPDKGSLGNTISLIEHLNLTENIDIVGPVENNQLFKYYQTHNVFLNTTSYESYGVAVMEAASCGIPIISTSVGELPFLWNDKENILLIDEFDEKVMASAVSRLLASEDLCTKLSEQAKINSAKYDWKNIKIEWIKLLNE
jgi:glycosyltransferase involved in cell wall biosynthesis